MFPVRNELSILQQPSASLMAFQLWGHFMFPRTAVPLDTFAPTPASGTKEVTMTVNNELIHETKRKIELKPIDSPESTSSSEYRARVPGLMFISLQSGTTRYAVVLCTKEEGFDKGSCIEIPKSWKSLIREDQSHANLEGNLVVRPIRWGDEVILKSVVSSIAASEVEKREPVDLSLDSKYCADAAGFSCDRCGKVFSYSYYRDKHLKYTRCVDNGDRKYPCPICPRSFEKRDRLRIHILHVHENHRPHLCTVCGKAFSQSSSLNKHLRVHSGERPYKCSFCPKAFTASSILRTHVRQHSGEKPFK
ncbi:unnamed protein product, partial [Cylicocyclus nassatus]